MKLILLSRSEVAEVHNVLAVPTEECCRWMRATGLLHSESPGGEGRRSRGRRRAVLRAGGEGAAERRDGDRNWVTAWCGCGQKVREMRLRPLKDSEEQDMPLVCACNVCVFLGGGRAACTHACLRTCRLLSHLLPRGESGPDIHHKWTNVHVMGTKQPTQLRAFREVLCLRTRHPEIQETPKAVFT